MEINYSIHSDLNLYLQKVLTWVLFHVEHVEINFNVTWSTIIIVTEILLLLCNWLDVNYERKEEFSFGNFYLYEIYILTDL